MCTGSRRKFAVETFHFSARIFSSVRKNLEKFPRWKRASGD